MNYTDSEASKEISFGGTVVDYSTLYTSNVTLSTTGGTSATASKVKINNIDYDAIKAGSNKKAGVWCVTVPAGTTTLHLHALAWSGENNSLTISGADCTPDSISLTANTGISGTATTYTLSSVVNDYFKISLNGIVANTKLTFTVSGGKRFVVWGVNAE